jgi:hypothetical protein
MDTSFKTMVKGRMEQRAEARKIADELVALIVERMGDIPTEKLERVLSMVHAELQALTSLTKKG